MVTQTIGVRIQTGERARKRHETRQQIAETGLKLFLAQGYARTTIDDIAAGAGISRRTFFSYFKSKDDVILAWQTSEWDAICAGLLKVSPDEAPLDAVRKTLMNHISQYESERMRAIDEVIRSSETLLLRKHATYAMQEESLYAVLCEVWRQPHRQGALRAVAMISIGALRIAVGNWSQRVSQRSPAEHLEESFNHLKIEIRSLSD